METYVEPTETHYETDKDGSPLQKISTAEADNNSSWLECNICLDTTHDPVVTLCGHLYCWPCIYKWLNFQSNSAAPTQCPVCKASISETSLVPLYGRANKEKEGKRSSQGLDIPGRPPASPNGVHHSARPIPSPRQLHRNPYSGHPTTPSSQPPMFSLRGTLMSPSGTTPTSLDPLAGMFGEMVYARVFGNASATSLYFYPNSYNHLGSMSPRLRRQQMQADKSLNRVSIFLICFIVLCFILF